MHGPPARPKSSAPFPALILATGFLTLALLGCARPALCAGALPWEAPTTTGQNATAPKAEPAAPAAQQRPDPDSSAQEGVLRTYYQYMMTLDERLPELYSRRVREQEAVALATMRHMQRRRGTLGAFAAARVYLDELTFTRVTGDPDLARWKVAGKYHVAVGSAFESVDEDALFVLLPEDGTWKIYERREDAR